jgi:hypothetical protein
LIARHARRPFAVCTGGRTDVCRPEHSFLYWYVYVHWRVSWPRMASGCIIYNYAYFYLWRQSRRKLSGYVFLIPVRRKKAMSACDVCSLSLAYLRRKTKCREVLPARTQKCDMHLKFCFWSCKVSPQMANYTTLLFSLCKHQSNGILIGAWC